MILKRTIIGLLLIMGFGSCTSDKEFTGYCVGKVYKPEGMCHDVEEVYMGYIPVAAHVTTSHHHHRIKPASYKVYLARFNRVEMFYVEKPLFDKMENGQMYTLVK